MINMPRLSKTARNDYAMYIDPNTGRRRYNGQCRRCRRGCKQSYFATIVECPRYVSRRTTRRNTQP